MIDLTKVKTPCCKAEWYCKGRANYRCVKCDKDITMHLYYIVNSEEEDNEFIEKRNN